jgi:hypothetical protein
LAVERTTKVVAAGYSQTRWRQREREVVQSARAHHTAHPTWRLGMAAYWLMSPVIPWGLDMPRM